MISKGSSLQTDFKPEDITELIKSVQTAIQGSEEKDRISVGGSLGHLEPMTRDMERERRVTYSINFSVLEIRKCRISLFASSQTNSKAN